MGHSHGMWYWMTTGAQRTGISFAGFVSGSSNPLLRSLLIYLLRKESPQEPQESLSWSGGQCIIADKASKSLPSGMLVDWTKMRLDFDQDPTKPNLYEEPKTCKYLEHQHLPQH